MKLSHIVVHNIKLFHNALPDYKINIYFLQPPKKWCDLLGGRGRWLWKISNVKEKKSDEI